MKSSSLIGYEIFIDKLDTLNFKKKTIINTINPHSYCVAKQDLKFQESLKESDLLIPDGIGIVWASQVLKGKKIQRITGSDIHIYLLKQAQKLSLKVFYIGASEETLAKIEARIQSEYPAIRCKSFSPPFKHNFSEEDNRKMCEVINAFKPDILFVGMTAPKQEKWVHQNKEKIESKVICSIGAVFDFYARKVKRAPQWMQKTGLEWLHRSIISPTRLGKRNMRSNPEFIWDLLKYKLLGNS